MSPDLDPDWLHISVRRDTTGLRLCLIGELDIATAAHLLDVVELVDARTSDTGPAKLRLDLTDLTFLDASGLSALVQVGILAGARGATLSITGARPMARRLLEMTTLREVLDDRVPTPPTTTTLDLGLDHTPLDAVEDPLLREPESGAGAGLHRGSGRAELEPDDLARPAAGV